MKADDSELRRVSQSVSVRASRFLRSNAFSRQPSRAQSVPTGKQKVMTMVDTSVAPD
jgi:hypothetical protein